MKLSIVIAAYNRPDSLKRLLRSLDATVFPKRCKPDLFICIDGKDDYVVASAFTFTGNPRPKCVFNEKHLGLKDHLIRCLNLGLENHDACILLEDDLFVSPYFLHWCIEALDLAQGFPDVAAISLYAPAFNEYAGLPFIPLPSGYDSYCMQVPASSGVCWTKHGWHDFNAFLKAYPVVHETARLPSMVKGWPDTSLKKHLADYLLAMGKTYLYPRVSFTTNFGDPGTHFGSQSHKFQVPLHTGPWRELSIGASNRSYDAFMETTFIIDHQMVGGDFYGLKPPTKGLRVASRPHSNPIKSWGMRMIPPEANIFYDISGDDIHMGEADGFVEPTPETRQKLVNLYSRFTLPTPDLEHYWRKRATQCQGWTDVGGKEQYNQGRADAFTMCADEWGKVPKLM